MAIIEATAADRQAFGTAMPAFRDTLKPDDIWAIITCLRAGLPANADGKPSARQSEEGTHGRDRELVC